MNTMTNRFLIKTCQTVWRLNAGSRLVRRPVIMSITKRCKSDATEEGQPLKFTESKAFHHKPINQMVSYSSMKRPRGIISLYVSFIVLSVYLYYREGNDLDDQLSKTLDQALEEHGFNTDDLKKNLKTAK